MGNFDLFPLLQDGPGQNENIYLTLCSYGQKNKKTTLMTDIEMVINSNPDP